MLYSLFAIALRNIRSNKHTMMTAFASIVLSITMITLIVTFVSQARDALIQDARERTGGIDIFVSGNITQDYIEAIDNLRDVNEVLHIHQDNLAIMAEHNWDRKLNVYTVGIENTPIAKKRYRYESDILGNQAVISASVAEFLEVCVGEYIVIYDKNFEVIEKIGFQGCNFYGFEIAIISFADFSQLVGSSYGNHLGIAVYEPQNTIEVLSHIRQIDGDMNITSISEALDDVENMSSLQILVFIFSGIVILACSFMVIFNFQSFIEHYRRQFSIMRSFGTSTAQLWKIIFLQGGIVVGSGAVAGLLLTFVLHAFVFRVFTNVLSLTVLVSLNISMAIFVTVIFASVLLLALSVPAIAGSCILPIQAIREVEDGFVQKKWKNALGFVLLGLSFTMFLLFVIGNVSTNYIHRGRGVAAIILYAPTIILLFPFMLKHCLNLIHKIVRSVLEGTQRGIVDIAIANMTNNLLTTKNIVFSICLAFLVATFGGSLLHTINNNISESMKLNYFLDITVSDILGFQSQLDESFLYDIGTIEGCENTVLLSHGKAHLLTNSLEGMHYDVGYISVAALVSQGKLDIEVTNLDSIAVITRELAEAYNFAIGDDLTLWYNPNLTTELMEEEIPITDSFVFTIGGVVDKFYFTPFLDIYIDWSNQVMPPDEFIFDRAFISSNDIDETVYSLYSLRDAYPEVRWTTVEEVLQMNATMFRERYGMFLMILFAVVISLCLGVINTVFGGIYKRRKEYAILRVVGVEKKVIARTVYLQILLYLVIGGFAGIMNGGLFVSALTLIDGTNMKVDYVAPAGVVTLLSFLLIATVGRRISQILNEDILEQVKD